MYLVVFLKVRALTNKTAASVVAAFESIYPSNSPPPHVRKIRTDLGLKFRSGKVNNIFLKRGIRHKLATPPLKAGYAECCIQSPKQLIYKYLYHSNSYRYINVPDKLVENYNGRPHRSLGNVSKVGS